VTGRAAWGRIARAAGLAVALALVVALGVALGARTVGADAGNAGLTVATFLAVPPGASAPGMAGTTLALGGDLVAATSNPASLGWVRGPTLALSHSQLPDGSRHEWASVGAPFGGSATHWSLAGLYAGQEAFEGRDASNQPTGSFSPSSAAIGLTLAQALGRHLALGLGSTFVSENLVGATGTGVTFGAGLIARAGPLGFGASAENVGGTMTYGGARYGFPTSYGVGVALDPAAGFRLEVDANFPESYYDDVRAGAEYRWHDRVALRAGYRLELAPDPTADALTGLSFGMGAGVGGLWLDYAYLPSSAGGDNQRFGIVLSRGRPSRPPELQAQPDPGLPGAKQPPK
jgi:hypothetical protein